ncbi:MAG: hypothetical protein M1831_003629 [Alyxoria varia]|nr:MAG: hypothetical protein M1831_003629 [Alyxoria varia]
MPRDPRLPSRRSEPRQSYPYPNDQRLPTHHGPNSRTPSRNGSRRSQQEKPTGRRDRFLSKTVQGHIVAMSGEFVGTTMFLYFAYGGTQIANTLPVPPTTDPTLALVKLLYISLAFGGSLAVTAWVFYRVSGGLFNPAVTLGMCLAGTLPWIRGLLLFPAQMFGGMVAAGLVSSMFPGALQVSTTLTNDTSIARGLFIEMFLTIELVLAVLFLAAEKTKATFIAPVGIGMALFVAEITGVNFTGGSLNPTRSFGPCVATREFPGYHWIYWLGPALGAAVSAGYYRFAKFFEYEEANPGQDDSFQSEGENEVRGGSGAVERSKSR